MRDADPADGAALERVVGLPPAPEAAWQPPSTSDLNGGRVLNLLGLVSPVANVAMLRVSPPELRWYGVVAGVLLYGAGAVFVATGRPTAGYVAFGLHVALVVLGVLHPRWPEHVFRGWNAIGALLGKVMQVPIFALIYFLAVTPVALLMRALGKDPLRRSAPREESYWVERDSLPTERFHRQF